MNVRGDLFWNGQRPENQNNIAQTQFSPQNTQALIST